MHTKRIGAMLASFVIGASGLGACSSTSTTAVSTTPVSAAVPPGWKTVSFGKARISVPSTWTVEHGDRCPDHSVPGMLRLAPPTQGTQQCPASFVDANTVSLSLLQAGPNPTSWCPLVRINGLRVHVGPCRGTDPLGIVLYSVPSLGIYAAGTGTADENVTGPGTGTVVGQVLHTLR
jgi:hypothetical protein